MDYRRRVKALLISYRSELQYIKNLEEQIRDTYESANRLTTEYNEHIGHSSVEPVHPGAKLAFSQKFQTLQQDLKEAKILVNKLDQALSILPILELRIIQARYIEGKPVPWRILAREINYSERQTRRLCNKAFNSIAVSLYGIEEILGLKGEVLYILDDMAVKCPNKKGET